MRLFNDRRNQICGSEIKPIWRPHLLSPFSKLYELQSFRSHSRSRSTRHPLRDHDAVRPSLQWSH